MSHIYYSNRDALLDRVTRFTSDNSVASIPRPRTLHHQTNFTACDDAPPGCLRIACNWSTNWYLPLTREENILFGRQKFELTLNDEELIISKKYVEIFNDYIPTMIDIYML